MNVNKVGSEDLGELVVALGQARNQVSSLLCEAAKAYATEGSEGKATKALRDKARIPGREARKLVRVGEALDEMPNLAKMLKMGDVTLDHASALASAAEACSAEVVNADSDLLKKACHEGIERFAKRAREFAAEHSTDRGKDRLETQREARKASLFRDDLTGMGILHGEWDPISFHLLQQTVDLYADALWRRDGGDDNPTDEQHRINGKPWEKHQGKQRTYKQRMSDAIFEIITGRDSTTHEPLPEDNNASHVRVANHLIVTADIGVLDGTKPNGRCEIVGHGTVHPSIIRTLSPDTELSGMLFDRQGRPIWLGRQQRLANTALKLALAVRDGGCVLCDAPPHHCQAHHVREWSKGGRTDPDNLATLCRTCHRSLHNQNQVLNHSPATGWQARTRTQSRRDAKPGEDSRHATGRLARIRTHEATKASSLARSPPR